MARIRTPLIGTPVGLDLVAVALLLTGVWMPGGKSSSNCTLAWFFAAAAILPWSRARTRRAE
ncbi:MAG TPA: hypothetical protein VFK66_07120 [Oryzihumus sp.]|nr:hypothetical protein [Oryzihumus sp.]